ncbi:MAG: Ig-like domain-containing protein [Planctomycetes bacterium]|nr:Ig-like domain-containing protein [Planctomycetota bacterium]
MRDLLIQLRRGARLSPLLLAAALGACREGGGVQDVPFVVDGVWPREGTGVFLNEAIVVHFSDDVERTSVTNASFIVRRAKDGRPARGRLSVDGPRVRFDPLIPLTRSLEDAGLLPGTRYEVLIRGYPHLDGIRSVRGAPLAASTQWQFATAERTDPPRQLFDDRTPAFGAPLTMQASTTAPDEPLQLECAEPLDPTTLEDDDFTLHLVTDEGPVEETPVWLRLLINEHPTGAQAGRAVVEVRPRRSLVSGTYLLRPSASLRLRDFAGNQVWLPPTPSSAQGFVVEVQEAAGEAATQSMSIDFLDTSLRSPIGVPGADGTATWAGDGTVLFRIPAACGDGSRGEVSLEGLIGDTDLNTVRLSVQPAAEATLASDGLVVLRSQGAMTIQGTLTRSGNAAAAFDDPRGLTVSQWLERASLEERAWTVLVAGGDLILEGEIKMDGPLALVAGGRIRIVGEVEVPAGKLWLVGEGGGLSVDSRASRPRLEIDEPINNPLVEPLYFAVLSAPLPPWGGVERWLGADASGRAGSGSWELAFLPEDIEMDGMRARADTFLPQTDPRLLPSKSGLRLLIKVHAAPAVSRGVSRWVAPAVDSTLLRWERTQLGSRFR